MSAISIVAFGALSAMGEGTHAVHAGEVNTPARVAIERDAELLAKGLAHPYAARVSRRTADPRAAALLWQALADCALMLDRNRPGWKLERIGLILGTACGEMRSAQPAFETLERGGRISDIAEPTYFGPIASAARRLGLVFDPSLLVLGACASSTLAIGLAMRFLERNACDLVLAGGFDEVTDFVAAGFESLRAISASGRPRPFRIGRDGMALGEGAAVLALARAESEAGVLLRGFGAAADALHLTAPDREGGALSRAARAALEEAGSPRVDLVSAHATATPMNDAAEYAAMVRVVGALQARDAVVHPFKAQIGHTMGAAGALELLAAVDAIERKVAPAAAGYGGLDPLAPARLLDVTTAGAARTALKLSSAFGGCNAAILVGEHAGASRRPRAAFLHEAVSVERSLDLSTLAAACQMPIDRVDRCDGLVRLALSAVAHLRKVCGPFDDTGVVVGSAFGPLETNADFARRLRERGARGVEPRRFPYTSPNASAGECSIAFGLTGPSFSTGGGMHAAVEAFCAAAILIESGDAENMVVVGVDEGGDIARSMTAPDVALRAGAVAVLLTARPQECSGKRARARVGSITLRRGQPSTDVADRVSGGHLALLPLVGRAVPTEVISGSPPDVVARVGLEPL